jgi:hypothetical protein
MSNRALFAVLIAASVTAVSAFGARPSVAQNGTPEVTPFPLDHGVEPLPVTDKAAQVDTPTSAQLVAWTPDGGQLVSEGNKVTVKASSTVPFDTNSARFFLRISTAGGSTFGPEQTPTASFTNSNRDATITADVSGTGVLGIVFSIRDTDGVKAEKEFTVGRGLFLPIAFREYFYPPLNLTTLSGNTSACTALGPLIAGRIYEATIGAGTDSINDWYFSDVSAGATFRITIDTPPTQGTQLQAYAVASTDCTQISSTPTRFVELSATNTMTLSGLSAGRVFYRIVGPTGLPFAAYKVRVEGTAGGGAGGGGSETGTFEDNDNPCQATKTNAGTVYTSNIDDTYDFYEINVPSAGYIRLMLDGHNSPGQMQLRSPVINANCDPINSTTRIDPAAFIVNGNAQYVKYVTPGVYYARIGPVSEFKTEPYRFLWTYLQQATGPQVDICEALTNCVSPLIGANKVTLYWKGLPIGISGGGTNLRFETQLTGEPVQGRCPAGGLGQTANFDVTANQGSRDYTTVTRGFYKLKVRIFQGTAQLLYNEYAVKMDCDFLANGAQTSSIELIEGSSMFAVDPVDAAPPGSPEPAP